MLTQLLIKESRYYLKSPYEMVPEGIVIHNTAGTSSARDEISYMENNEKEVSFHAAIDDKEAVQCIPFNHNAWHAGDGANGIGNRKYIGIEICYSLSGGQKFLDAEKRTAKEVAELLSRYNWGIEKVKKHQEFSSTDCPHRTIELGWDRFINMIKAEMNTIPKNLPPISITDLTVQDYYKDLSNLTELKGIVLYCTPSYFKYDKIEAYTENAERIIGENQLYKEDGIHFLVEEDKVYKAIPETKICKHLKNGTPTYINNNYFKGDANTHALSVMITSPEGANYIETENMTIKFIAVTLLKNGLTVNSLFRGFDLNKEPSPMHLLNKEKWGIFLDKLTKIYNAMKAETYDDSLLKTLPSTMSGYEMRKIYSDNKGKEKEYAAQFEPDDRGIPETRNGEEKTTIDSFEKNGSLFSYTNTNCPPTSSTHCDRAFDKLRVKITSKPLQVEPIYPDIVIPPGGSVVIVDSTDETGKNINSNVSLSLEDFEKRQKTFNIKNFAEIKKEVKGKPVNNEDPYPVDDKIKELESHAPKVKIDQVNFKFNDTNHPGSLLAKELAKDLALIQDEIISISRRTERRLVCLENNLSIALRYLFRASSRMQINCVYYGGQDVFGKYKCIRCLHDDRINDGQSMTLDQCLSCTRYEPIVGQIYAILDETGSNVSQIVDDLQMSYMDLKDYISLTRVEEMHTKKNFAKVDKKLDSIPKKFSEGWDKGFTMDWNDVVLETQSPDVAEYKVENINEKKPEKTSDNQKIEPPEFIDKRKENSSYEELIFNSDDYEFNNFGNNEGSKSPGTINDPNFGLGASELRNKIVEYAKSVVDRCKQGKAGYSQGLRGQEVNGILYHDCSSFVAACYNNAGLEFGSYTGNQYPLCYSSAGGKLWPISGVSEALPGDAIFFATYPTTPADNGFPDDPDKLPSSMIGAIGHVAVYIGNGEMMEAKTDEIPLVKQIDLSKINNSPSVYCFARPKVLVDADAKSGSSPGSGGDSFDYNSQGFTSDVTQLANQYCSGQVDATIDYMNQYGYKQAVINSAKKCGFDPYWILGLIATESSGNPTSKGTYYWGLMQTHKDVTRATTKLEDIEADIETGCEHLVKMTNYISQSKNRTLILGTYAYNAGNGNVDTGCNAYGDNAHTVGAGVIGPYIARAAADMFGEYKLEEVSSYVAKIILRANEFKNRKTLE